MNVNLEVELSDLLYKVKELRVAAKYISNEPIRGDILRIADQLEQSEKRIRELTISKNPYRYLDEFEFQNQEIIRNVEWIVADQKKQTVFESLQTAPVQVKHDQVQQNDKKQEKGSDLDFKM